MKNKHSLQHHPDNAFRTVTIKNMKSREQMLMEKIGNNILKRIPGCENHFIGSTGQIRESLDQKNNHPIPSNPEVRPFHSLSQNHPHQSGFRAPPSSHDFRHLSLNVSTGPQYLQQPPRIPHNGAPPTSAHLSQQEREPLQYQAGY